MSKASALREQVMERCNYSCVNCGSTRNLEMDHIIPRWKFGSKRKKEQDQLSNLQMLCNRCHQLKHNRFPKFSVVG